MTVATIAQSESFAEQAIEEGRVWNASLTHRLYGAIRVGMCSGVEDQALDMVTVGASVEIVGPPSVEDCL